MATFQVDQLEIHCRIKGNGPPLLILHGIGSNSASWSRVAPLLEKSFTIIAWDAPGYGLSSDPLRDLEMKDYANIIRKLLSAMNLEKVYLLGHSLGGVMAQTFYELYPECVEALILADTSPGGSAGDSEINKQKLERRLYAIEHKTPEQLAEDRVPALLSSFASEEVFEEAKQIMSQVRRPGYRSAAISLAMTDTRKVLDRIDVPTLIICGELDQATPLRISEYLSKAIKNAEFHVIPQTGHLCYMENPQLFSEIVMQFLTAQTQLKGRVV